jgi:hypothetical protein
MGIDQTQKNAIAEWIANGMNLSLVQTRLKQDFGLTLTFMELRLLVDDLNIEIQKPAAPEPEAPKTSPGPSQGGDDGEFSDAEDIPGVSVEVDNIVTPGSMVSGSVQFSDGVRAKWHIDQMGRLGLSGVAPGYQPDPMDIQEFQMQLQMQLKRKGLA